MPILQNAREVSPVVHLVVCLVLCFPHAAVSAQELVSISGRVIDAVTMQPLASTIVQLEPVRGGEKLTTLSTGDGTYAFSTDLPGRYTLTASRRGYVSTVFGQSTDQEGMELVVHASRPITNLTIRLLKSSSISGTVSDANGKVFYKAVAEALRQGPNGMVRIRETLSDDLGNYRLADLPPGEYKVRASYLMSVLMTDLSSINVEKNSKLRVGMPTFFGNTPLIEGAKMLKLEPGSEITGVDIQLTDAEPNRLSGTVVAEGGGVVEGTIWLLSASPLEDCREMRRVAGVKENAFRFTSLASGEYVLIGELRANNLPLTSMQVVRVTGVDQEIIIHATPLASLKASLEWPDEAPPAPTLELSLIPKCYAIGPRKTMTRLTPDGTFSLRSVVPADYEIQITGLPRFHFLRSVEEGSGVLPLLGRRIQISPGATSMKLQLDSRGSYVDGTISKPDGTIIENARIEFTRLGEPDWPSAIPFTTKADHNGYYSIPGLPAGEYRMSVAGLAESTSGMQTCAVEPSTATLLANTSTTLKLTMVCAIAATKPAIRTISVH